MKTAVILSGGDIDHDFALAFLNKTEYKFLIGADQGIHFLHQQRIFPTHIVGDFDSADQKELDDFKKNTQISISTFQAEKDFTDTQIAVELALSLDREKIYILGGMGRRADHFLANIRVLAIAEKAGVPCFLVDPWNRIRVADRPLALRRSECFGKYVSLFALGGTVTGVTLTGFKYPLVDYRMTGDDPIGVSNEITEEAAKIDFSSGTLIVAESREHAE